MHASQMSGTAERALPDPLLPQLSPRLPRDRLVAAGAGRPAQIRDREPRHAVVSCSRDRPCLRGRHRAREPQQDPTSPLVPLAKRHLSSYVCCALPLQSMTGEERPFFPFAANRA